MNMILSMSALLAILVSVLTKVLLIYGQDMATFEDCGGVIDITETEKGFVKSPNYPKDPDSQDVYDNNLDCVWEFTGPNENTLFFVKFFDLVLEYGVSNGDPNGTICYDFLNITIGSEETEQFCGFKKPEELVKGVAQRMTANLVTDGNTGYRGFVFYFQGKADFDACANNPCVNGECNESEDRTFYTCECESGYTGYVCNVDIDECASDPCKNGGSCQQTKLDGYYCVCSEGWQGDHCEIVRKPNPCLSNPCQNEGTCTPSDDNEEFSCECVPGYSGRTCRAEIDECLSDPCQNGGTCVDKVNKFECQCELIYYGDLCENKQKINGCEKAPCSENGDCVSTDDEGGYICECLPGWTGNLCEDDLAECDSSPCQNNGVCDDTLRFNHYQCECVGGYTGRNCEIEIDPSTDSEKNHPNTLKPTTDVPVNGLFSVTIGMASTGNPFTSNQNLSSPPNFTYYPITKTVDTLNLTSTVINTAAAQEFNTNQSDIRNYTNAPMANSTLTSTQSNLINSPETPTTRISTTARVQSTTLKFLTTTTDIVSPCLEKPGTDVIQTSAFGAPPMCKNPGIPYIEDDTQWIAGSILKFYCIEGYILEGPENLTCLKNESWSKQIPLCIEDRNSTSYQHKSSVSPWLATMITLSLLLATTLVAFVLWIVYKGASLTKIMRFSQSSLSQGDEDPLKQC